MSTVPTSVTAGEATSSVTWTGSPAKVRAPRSAGGESTPSPDLHPPPPGCRVVCLFFPLTEIYSDARCPSLRVKCVKGQSHPQIFL